MLKKYNSLTKVWNNNDKRFWFIISLELNLLISAMSYRIIQNDSL